MRGSAEGCATAEWSGFRRRPAGGTRRFLRRLLIALLAAAVLAACGRASGAGRSAPSAAGISGSLTVFAAASLTDAFEELGEGFRAAHPDVSLVFNFAGSSSLAAQLRQGAPADVFAAADSVQMRNVREQGLLAEPPRDFAANVLTIAVEPGNPLDIRGLRDLADRDVVVVLAAEEVPAGRYARRMLDAQGISLQPASLESDVRAVLFRVALGEADAGIVYASDAAASAAVDAVAISEAANVTATYPIARLASAQNPAAATAFIDYVLSTDAQEVLRAHGFRRAPTS